MCDDCPVATHLGSVASLAHSLILGWNGIIEIIIAHIVSGAKIQGHKLEQRRQQSMMLGPGMSDPRAD